MPPCALSARLLALFAGPAVYLAAGMACGVAPAHADAAPAPHDAPVELRFADFFRMPVGPRGLELSPALLAADGRLVRLRGFMVAEEVPQPGGFLLTPRPVRLHQHADGDADDLPPATVQVLLDPSHRDRVVVHRAGPIELSGRLSVGRGEDASGRVRWLRLQLPPEALAQQQPTDTAPIAAAALTPSAPSASLTPLTPPTLRRPSKSAFLSNPAP